MEWVTFFSAYISKQRIGERDKTKDVIVNIAIIKVNIIELN